MSAADVLTTPKSGELLRRILGRRIPHQLDFVEFVRAEDAACVFTRRTSLAAKAWSVGDEPLG